MSTTTVDLTRCPHCQASPLGVLSLERLLGHADVFITVEADGTQAATWGGSTDVLWDESTTVEYFCASCRETLPEPMQAELDRLLPNTRELEAAQ